MPSPTWSKISLTQVEDQVTAPWGQYFFGAAIKRTGPADIWTTWKGLTWWFRRSSNTWVRDTVAQSIGSPSRENFDAEHDVDNSLLWVGAGAPAGAGFEGLLRYLFSSSQYAVDGAGMYGACSVLAADAAVHRLYNFAGFNQSNRGLLARNTSPLAAGFTDLAPSGVWPTLLEDPSRLSTSRGGIDSRDGSLWFMADNNAYYRYNRSQNRWVNIPYTGVTPALHTVWMLHEAANCLVGYCGYNVAVAPASQAVLQTYIIDLATNVCSFGPSGSAAPTACVMSQYNQLYDGVNGDVLLLATPGSNLEVWKLAMTGAPPPPTLYSVILHLTGNGSGIVTGAGAHTAGATVDLTATAAAGSHFDGYFDANGGAFVEPFTMPAAQVDVYPRFTLDPINPPPTPNPLNLTPRVFKAFPLPGITTNSAPWEAGGVSKDVNGCYNTKLKRLCVGSGDFSFVGASNSGNPCFFEVTPETQTWETISGLSHPAGQITPNHPTDRGPHIYDPLRDCYWNHNAVPFPDTEDQATSGGSIYKSGLLRLDRTTKAWTQLAGRDWTNSIGGGACDTAADAMIFFEQGGFGPGVGGRLRVVPLSNPTGASQTFNLDLTPTPRWTSAAGGWLVAQQPERSFFAWDNAHRKAYIVCLQKRLDLSGNVVETRATFYCFDRNTNTFSALPSPPMRSDVVLDPYVIFCVFDDNAQAIIWPVCDGAIAPAGVIKQLLVYSLATSSWEDVATPLSHLRGNSAYYHPGIKATLLAGSVFDPTYTQQNYFLYLHAAPPDPVPDTIAPVCAVTAPASLETVSGTAYQVTGTATDEVGVTEVEWFVDGVSAKVQAAATGFLLNTTTLINGNHTIHMTAKDAAHNVGTSTVITFKVQNTPPPPAVPPVCTITSHANGAPVSGTITVTATITDADGVARGDLLVAGALHPTPDFSAPFSWSVNTTGYPDGPLTLQVKGLDNAGDVGFSAIITVTVGNAPAPDTVRPTCAITSHVAGDTLTGVVTLTGTAADNVAVTRTRFFCDNVPIGDDFTAPYSVSFDTTDRTSGVPNGNGPHVLSMRAYDAAGNEGIATEDIPVLIDNTPPSTPPPTATLNSPGDGDTLGGTFDVEGEITGVVTRVVVEIDDVPYPGAVVAQQPELLDLTPTLTVAGLSSGPHTLRLRAFTAAGLSAVSATIDIFVEDVVAPTPITIRRPAPGATMTGIYDIIVDSGDIDVRRIRALMDGVEVAEREVSTV